ncbi:MAG: helix-turn-helix transcriptional regulator [Acidobacteriota bacterium]
MVDPRGTAGAIGRVARLEELKLLLAEREYTTTADLAADLGVSLRTLYRDLATLRELGLPIGGLSGRGGGVFLERGWSLGRVHLNESEAMGLLLALAIAQQVNSPLLLGDIRSIERKVTQAFAPSQAANIRSLRRRVVIGPPASSAVLAGYHPPVAAITRPILEAFTAQRLVEVGYRDQTETRSERAIEIHYLYYSMPVWYALAWDRLRGGVRSFRIDRITTATTAAERFKLEPPDEFLAAVEATTRHL